MFSLDLLKQAGSRILMWAPPLVGFIVGLTFAYITTIGVVVKPTTWINVTDGPVEPARPTQNGVGTERNSTAAPPPHRLNSTGSGPPPRILCWIMTQPASHETRARHVRDTWGRRCDILLFMSTQDDQQLPAIALPVGEESRNMLWAKTKEAFSYVFNHHFNDADWFFKADDDTYAVMENMQQFLSQYSTDDPIYFGCHFKLYTPNGYMSGGAGYVLSREALKRFVTLGLPDPTKCKPSGTGAEDVEMGKCLERLGVMAGDARDAHGGYRFNPFKPDGQLQIHSLMEPKWYWQYIFYPMKTGLQCCSDTVITFHYVSPQQMHTLEYLLYGLRVGNSTCSLVQQYGKGT